MSAGDFLAYFRGVKAEVGGSWMAFCPAHPDGTKRGNRSLHISREDDKWLLKCFSGCTTDQIVISAGLD